MAMSSQKKDFFQSENTRNTNTQGYQQELLDGNEKYKFEKPFAINKHRSS